MTNVPTIPVTVSIPKETYMRLLRFAKARNSPLDNAASAAITDGIDANITLFDNIREQMGETSLHPMCVASRLLSVAASDGIKMAVEKRLPTPVQDEFEEYLRRVRGDDS